MLDSMIAFLKEAYAELQKVTWMSRQEVIGSTVVILVLVAIISLFVTAIDFVFIKFIGWIL